MFVSLTTIAFLLFLGFGSCLSYALPLHDAAKAGDVAQAALVLMDDPSEINVKDGNGSTPLAAAVQEGHLEMVRFLLEKGASINTKANYRGAPLTTAAFYSNPAVVKLLRAKIPLEASGATPLYIATQEGHVEIVRLLLEKGAAIEAAADDGVTPLSSAVFHGNTELVQLLLEQGAMVGGRDNNGVTPLARGAQQGHVEAVLLLIKEGAEVDSKDNNGVTPLARAAQHGHIAMVRLLLEKGAVIDANDNNGVTPLARATQSCDRPSRRHLEIVKFLLEKGADPTMPAFGAPTRGKTILQIAEEQAQDYKEIAGVLRQASSRHKSFPRPEKSPVGSAPVQVQGHSVHCQAPVFHDRGRIVECSSDDLARVSGNDHRPVNLILTLPAISVSWPQPRVDGAAEEDSK